MKKSTFIASAALPAALAVMLAGCASEPEQETGGAADQDGDTGEEAAGEEGGELTIGMQSDIVAVDPHTTNDIPSSNLQVNIYDRLIYLTEDMELEPMLATDWEVLEDDLWEFNLRDDVTFHDGSEFNAEVVKANLERVLDEEIASPRANLFEMIEEVIVEDEFTVRIKTEYPFGALGAHLGHTGGSMISKEAIEADYAAMEDGGDPGSYINSNSSGSGFFELEERVSGDSTTLARNEEYWGEQPKVDSVTFRVIGDAGQIVNSVEAGEIDIAFPIRPNDMSRVEGTEGVELYVQDSVSMAYVGFNNKKEPYDDPKVRQALSMAIDKDVIINSVLEGAAEKAVGPVSESVFGFDDSVEDLGYDPERARELLAEAGYEDGFETSIWTNDSAEREDIAVVVQSQLEEIGVDASIEVLEWGAYLDETAAGNHDMFILGWSTGTGDADFAIYSLFHSSQQGTGGNKTFIEDDELDSLIEEARRETDEAAREEIYSEIIHFLRDEAPMMYLYHTDYLVGVGDQVGGFWKHPTGLFMLQDVTVQ
ncbi:glutathione ABC transporter substrate-binding protein [Alteribacter natronophilus]|uniref:glutathione ABC transporter substrate-binding protein n=1 Tax=Alteribacter natronophilus TaxID=2583810 RepID=UPI00110E56C7|nr:glutathione ABC transporter substrate-binding protein [Alteribacter natronophilus]TMW72209.1 glutathione ABC transporter substrate-binding protein [Alteribacter natronophilus]